MKLKSHEIKLNPDNPRIIKDAKYKKLVQSLKDFPEMADVREIIVNKDHVILGGNMRFRAMQEAGWTEIPVKIVDWTTEQQREFIIKDNASFGEWDWDLLTAQYENEELEAWGLELPIFDEDEEEKELYTRNIESPVYTPSDEKPDLSSLIDIDKTTALEQTIKSAKITDAEKEFLLKAAQRHNVFDYAKIADFYAHSSKEVQQLMEQSALVIIDFDQAVENGFVELVNKILEVEVQDHAG